MDPGDFLSSRSRETSIHRDAAGRWFHDGQPLEHEKLAHAFDGWIEKAKDGRYCLKNDINWAYIRLDGAPYFVRGVEIDGAAVGLRLSGGHQEELVPDTLLQDRDGVLYCRVRHGLLARFDSHAAAQLAELVEEDAEGVYLRLGNDRVRPPVADPLQDP